VIAGGILGPFVFGHILDLTSSFYLGWLVLGCIAIALSLPMIPLMLKEIRKNVKGREAIN